MKKLKFAVLIITFFLFSCGGSDDSSGGNNTNDTTAFVRMKIDGVEVFYKENVNPGKAEAFITNVPVGINPANTLMIIGNLPGESSIIFHQNVNVVIKDFTETTGTFNLSDFGEYSVHFTNNADPDNKYYLNISNTLGGNGTITISEEGENHGNVGKKIKGKISGTAVKNLNVPPYTQSNVNIEIEFNGGL